MTRFCVRLPACPRNPLQISLLSVLGLGWLGAAQLLALIVVVCCNFLLSVGDGPVCAIFADADVAVALPAMSLSFALTVSCKPFSVW